MVNMINGFYLYTKEPNTLADGFLYTRELYINTKIGQKKRTIRVFLPRDYDFKNSKKRFPVIYMMDGANLFDDYTSYAGEWKVDETINERLDKGLESFIVVGIDCPKNSKDRTNEMLPTNNCMIKAKIYTNPCAKEFGEWIINHLMPLINNTFFTLTSKEYTAVGGSSMGGLMAYYLGCEYHDKIGFSLCFSPAFMLYCYKNFMTYLNKLNLNPEECGKFYFYVGGVGFEKAFVKLTRATYKKFLNLGFNTNQVNLVENRDMPHHESAWSQYFGDACYFWLNNK